MPFIHMFIISTKKFAGVQAERRMSADKSKATNLIICGRHYFIIYSYVLIALIVLYVGFWASFRLVWLRAYALHIVGSSDGYFITFRFGGNGLIVLGSSFLMVASNS